MVRSRTGVMGAATWWLSLPVARVAVVIALAAGVVAMHSGGHSGHDAAVVSADSMVHHSASDSEESDDPVGGAGFMCLAILTTLTVLLGIELLVGTVRPIRVRPARSVATIRRGGRAPPSRYALRLKRIAVLRI